MTGRLVPKTIPSLAQLTRLCRSRRLSTTRAAWNSEKPRGSLHGSRATATSVFRAQKIESLLGATDPESSHKPTPLSPPPPAEEHISWTDKTWRSPATRERIYCNRSLNMQKIQAVGYDMDYTLAQYLPETFEQLAYDLTKQKLVENLNYPKEILDFQFDAHYMVRGLIVDKAKGNILKLDRHKYVKLAYHGFAELPRSERLREYGDRVDVFEEPAYAMVDTLFSLGETYLFAQLVGHMDAHPGLYGGKTYLQVYGELRGAVDLCHRDGSLKKAVAADPARYIHRDDSLVPLLELLRAAGKRVFLVTNSLWDYTNVVMNFLCEGRTGADRNLDWLRRFDLVVVGAQKPGFFTTNASILRVNPRTGALYNTDNGAPLLAVDHAPPPGGALGMAGGAAALPPGMAAEPGVPATPVFQGGSSRHLHSMLGVTAGSQVLYVGDHVYGDILRSKKQLGWRTMLVVPELAAELEVQARYRDTFRQFAALRHKRDALEDEIQRLEWAKAHGTPGGGGAESVVPSAETAGASVAGGNGNGAARAKQQGAGVGAGVGGVEGRIAALGRERDEIRRVHRELLREYHSSFHHVWGQLMKTGYQNSRFANQVERFACLYTSHVGNLLAYSPLKSYRCEEDCMPHE